MLLQHPSLPLGVPRYAFISCRLSFDLHTSLVIIRSANTARRSFHRSYIFLFALVEHAGSATDGRFHFICIILVTKANIAMHIRPFSYATNTRTVHRHHVSDIVLPTEIKIVYAVITIKRVVFIMFFRYFSWTHNDDRRTITYLSVVLFLFIGHSEKRVSFVKINKSKNTTNETPVDIFKSDRHVWFELTSRYTFVSTFFCFTKNRFFHTLTLAVIDL